jgi:anti-sigma factor RsiW
MVNCSDFLEDYSAFRDGLLPAGRAAEFDAHLAACTSCTRYDRVIGGGVELVREIGTVEPSGDFMDRLQHRIYHVEDEMRASRHAASGTSVAFTLAIAAAIGAAAWAPTMRPKVPQVSHPAVAANAPVRTETVPSVFRAGPLLTEDSRATLAGQTPQTIFFRYSPLGAYMGSETQAVLASQSATPR